MSRKERLKQLKVELSSRRTELLDMLNGRDKSAAKTQRPRTGDVGDAALYNTNSEMTKRISAMESDELRQIEIALDKFHSDRYGICEMSGKMIPIARLQALPFTRFSVEAQRMQEELGIDESEFEANWETAVAQESKFSDNEVNLRDISAGH